MGKNKALAHHTFAYFHTRHFYSMRFSVDVVCDVATEAFFFVLRQMGRDEA